MMSATRVRVTTVACLILASVVAPLVAASVGASASNSGFSPQMMTRVEASPVVYVLGSVGCSPAPCLELLRTNNDGASFVKVTAPPVAAAAGSPVGSLNQLVFATTQVGFALEGEGGEGVANSDVLYATYNGARTWKRVPEPPGGALSRIAVTANMLYGVTMHCTKQSNGNESCTNYRLEHTPLSVNHWVSSAIPNGSALSSGGYVGNVAAYGHMVWLTEGAKWSLLVFSYDHGSILNTFTPKWPALASVAGCDLTAFSTVNLWASCPTGMEVSFSFSGDGGGMWTHVPTDQFMGTGGGFFDPVSGTLAYLDYGGPRSLYRVLDAGRHLVRVGTLQCSKVNSSVNSMVFTSERNGLAICLPQDLLSLAHLERTIDGGAKWSRVIP